MTVSFSAGFLAWLLRGGSLLASFMTSMPMWARFDPLPILVGGKKRDEDKKKTEEQPEGDESEVTLFGVQAVLDAAEATLTDITSDSTTTNTTRTNVTRPGSK
jgi:hypothetical protein